MKDTEQKKVGAGKRVLNAFVDVFAGFMKGIKLTLILLPICLIALLFCFIFCREQTLAAFESIRGLFIK